MSVLERWWDGLLSDPERNSKIFAVVFLVQLIPFVVPLGFPMPYSFYTTDWYAVTDGGTTSYGQTFEGIQPGDVIVWGESCEHTGGYSTSRDFWATSPMFMVGERGAKLIMAWFGYPSISIFNDMVTRYFKTNYPDLTYGEDYLITEYLPGMEAAIAAFGEDIANTRDVRNHQPISSYPAFAGVEDMGDVTLAWGTVCRTTDHDMFIRQWANKFTDEGFHYVLAGEFAIASAYYGGLIKACWQYNYEMEHIVGTNYGTQFFGEEILKVESRELWTILYLPLLVWGLYVEWKRAIAEGVSLTPRVGERGQ